MIENEVDRLASEKSLFLDRLILEWAVKVINSVIVKYIEDKMQFCCSHMSHEVIQVLAIRLAVQPQLELTRSPRARERIHACWACSQ
jgi:hypothetical protein